MQLITNDNKGSRFFCVIGVYSKYARVDPLKDKKDIITTKTVQKINCLTVKQNTIWADKGKEFQNQSIKSLLRDNEIEMYSTHNERKSVPAERFNRT